MVALTELPPAELRPLLHQEIDRIRDEDLVAVHRVLMELEARRLAKDLGEDLAQDWASGDLTEAGIAQAVREHRQRHPYQ